MGAPVHQHQQNSTLERMGDTDKRRDRSRRPWLESSSSDSTLLGRAMSLKRRFASSAGSSTSSYSSRLSSSQQQRMRQRSSISRTSMRRVSVVAASGASASGVSRKAGVSFAGSLPSFASSSSSTSSKHRSCSFIAEPSSAAAAELLEHGVFRDVCTTLAALDDVTLLDMARKARRKLESVSKRQAMVGKWKRRSAGSPNCQVFDYKTKRRDQYSVVAKINLRCSLREIKSVLSTDHSTEFHRAMVALFGDQYVFGMNVKTMDCTAQANRRSVNSSRLGVRRRGSSRHSSASTGGSKSVRTAKLALNTVSLLRKHHLVWKQQNLSFVDYLEEKVDAKSVTRVLQTLDDDDDDEEDQAIEQNLTNFLEDSEMGLAASRQEQPTKAMTPLALELKGILAGYVIQEDSEEQFTRLFFYATHRSSGSKNKAKVSSQAVQILRDMAATVCKLEAVVLRRRFGSYPIIAPPTSISLWEYTKSCKSCCVPFNLLRKRHFCSLCGHYTCRKCSGVEDVEKTLGFIDRRRICVACVRRVGYCVFTVGGGTFVPKHNSGQTTFLMDRFKEEYENPPMLAADENDEMEEMETAMVYPLPQQSTDRPQPMSRRQRAEYSVQQLRLSLSYNSDYWLIHSDWREATTPKESICLLDSWATQSLTSASASRTEDRLMQSHYSA